MSIDSSSDISKTSVTSNKSKRSGKSLKEKILELGIRLSSEESSNSKQKLHYVVLKVENNIISNISVMIPQINVEQIIYYQPELNYDESSQKYFYKIQKFESKSAGPKELTRISDIEVKSFKPFQKMKFRKKKRHSSTISKIKDILNRGKSPQPSRDPSEESIFIDEESHLYFPKHINDLSEGILQKIFSMVPQKDRCLTLTKVCKSWYYILKDPIFWKELEFIGNKVSTQTIIGLLKMYSTLEKLKLISVPDILEILQELCRCNHGVKYLAVRFCNVGTQDFARIILHVVSCCTNLEVLDMKGMRFQSEKFYIELGRLKSLRSINLSGNNLLKNQDIITLAVNCRSLQDIRILDITLDNTQSTILKDDDLIFIASYLKQNLRTFKIDMQQLGNISYQAIFKCSLLENLTLKNCLLLSSDIFRELPSLTKLKKFKLTRAINVKAEDFQYVFSSESMQHIKHLHVNGCWNMNEIGLKSITHRLSCLVSLSLKNCKSVKRNDLMLLSSCQKLISLNIAHTGVDFNNLSFLPKYARNLRQLVVSHEAPLKVLQQLKKSIPLLIIKLSYSEFHKDERILMI